MKRDHSAHVIGPYYSNFFWKQCIDCGKDFKKEKGFQFFKPSSRSYSPRRFVCAECKPTIQDVEEFLVESGR